jgi:GT2 family glycosyltransferase
MAEKTAIDLHRVTAILVVHDGSLWLPEVVASIASQSRSVNQIIAVDTGSIDASSKLLSGAKIPTLSAPRDLGFGNAVQLGVEKLPASVSGAHEWLWILHDDCAPTQNALEKLLEAVVDRPQVVMAGPKLLGWHDRTHLLEVGVSIAGNGARWTGLEKNEYDQGQRDGINEVLSVSTAGALIRRDVFEELGGFDPELALFRDDVDFGWRARVAGHSVIVVTDAVAFHAQASATERRSIDVDGALLHRPLLLDRRNAAYVLLANSSWWLLPWLTIQLLGSAIGRALVYLIAKLPGYAGDELLAVTTLLIRPDTILSARKARKKTRMISARVVSSYIPPRWSQLRLSVSNIAESIRERLLPTTTEQNSVPIEINDDEDLLVPIPTAKWSSLLRKPQLVATIIIIIFTLIWSRNRLGSLVGGALPATPESAMDLWRSYLESWHQVGMGSASASPTWVAIIAALSTILFGKSALFITLFFLFAPLLMVISSFHLFAQFTKNRWLATVCALLYAISPVSIASINSGRLGTIMVIILLPILIMTLRKWESIDQYSWRRIWAISLLAAVIFAFSLSFIIISIFLVAYSIFRDYKKNVSFRDRLKKRLALLIAPFLINAPYSFEAILHPIRFLSEPGIAFSGGGPNLAIIGNPGGSGSISWWIVSPILLILLIALFSSSSARKVAEVGFVILLAGTFLSSLSISVHGNSSSVKIWVGTFIACATLASAICAVIILDKLREVLRSSHVHHRHYLAALLLVVTAVYATGAIFWTVGTGADSTVRSNKITVIPAFLGVEKSTKTLVIRQVRANGENELQFSISRGEELFLGEPDVSPNTVSAIDTAVRDLIDGSGLSTSELLSQYGIKYIFVKNPANEEVIRAIDGLGGFTRTSATGAGIIWKVSGATGRLIFTDSNGKRQNLDSGEIGVRTSLPGPGTLTLTENYSRSWRVLKDGQYLERSKNENGLPTFTALSSGEFSLIHDGTTRRGMLSLQLIFLVSVIVLALPAGRRKSQISEKELA